jgi:hypothetical protein
MVSVETGVALGLALASTTLTNLAYLREHDAASSLPPLSWRRPRESVRLLLTNRRWLEGFALESTGFGLYVAALALASIALVQSVAAGGIGILAFVSARVSHRMLSLRELAGVAISVLGLAALGISLAGGGSGGDTDTETLPILLWLAATVGVAVLVLTAGRRLFGTAAAEGIAGGLFFSIGDISTKVATQGGAHIAFAASVVGGYALGTWLLQLGYQRGAALTVAGMATLLTNALPIAAGPAVLDEPVPSGPLGVVRVLAFGLVTAGAILLARPGGGAAGAGAPTAVAS